MALNLWLVYLLVGALVYSIVFIAANRKPVIPQRRDHIRIASCAWVCLVTLEFWAFGPISHTTVNADMPFFLVQKFLAEIPHDGLFSHKYAGGNDLLAISIHSGQFVSFERILIAVLPDWLASSVHKLSVPAVGFIGAYLLSRRAFNLRRGLSFVLACAYTYSHYRIITITWAHGLGFAIVPLVLYVVYGRQGRRHYWLIVIAVSILNSISSSATHSNLALFAALGLAGVIFGRRAFFKALPAIFCFAFVVLANWHESLFAKAQLGPYSFRGADFEKATQLFDSAFLGNSILQIGLPVPGSSQGTLFLLVIGLMLSLGLGRVFAGRMFAAAGLSVVSGAIFQLLPWSVVGLGILSGLNFTNMNENLHSIVLLILASALSRYQTDKRQPGPALIRYLYTQSGPLILALAVAQMAWFKSYNSTVWLTEGGLSTVWRTEAALKKADLGRDGPIRTITVPHRISLNLSAVAGVDSFDGVYNLLPSRTSEFWQLIGGSRSHIEGGFMQLSADQHSLRCCSNYDLQANTNLKLLRLANVGAVLTTIPLIGKDLQKIHGPADDRVPVRNTDSAPAKISGYFREILDPVPLYIYALPDPLPRVFGAVGSRVVEDAVPLARFAKILETEGLRRIAVFRSSNATGITPGGSNLKVLNSKLVPDGYDVTIDPDTEGFLIVNSVYLPFWTAQADGRRVEIMPVNQIHMAIRLQKGVRNVQLRYRRPLLREVALKIGSAEN